jgi:hypothetical protein
VIIRASYGFNSKIGKRFFDGFFYLNPGAEMKIFKPAVRPLVNNSPVKN